MKSLIHIGGNKAASTLLQNQLLSNNKNFSYIGQNCNGSISVKEAISSLIQDDEFDYCRNYEQVLINRISNIQDTHKKMLVFSDEDIMTSFNPTGCSARLKRLLPSSKILIIIRNQMTAIPTWYVNHGSYLKIVPKRYWKKYISFDEYLEYCFNFPNYGLLEALNYKKFFKIFGKDFGEENIKLVLYEDLISDNKKFIKSLSQSLEVSSSIISDNLRSNYERKSINKIIFNLHRFNILNNLRNQENSFLYKVIRKIFHRNVFFYLHEKKQIMNYFRRTKK